MNKTKFLKFAIAVILGAVLAGALYAELQIESSIDNSVMTIKQINLTSDGKDGPAIITLDGSSTTPLKIEGNMLVGTTTGISSNVNKVSGTMSTVLGGVGNEVSNSNQSTVLGGYKNVVSNGSYSTVVGGSTNTINAQYSTIAGGQSNRITANYGFVAGGRDNAVLGLYGFAGGRYAISNAAGTFVWADSQTSTFTGSTANSFLIRALGGVAMGSTSATAPRAGYLLTVVGSGYISGNLQVGITGNKISSNFYCDQNGTGCLTLSQMGGTSVETDPTVNALAKATLTCTNGQIAKYNGTIWTCSSDLGITSETDPIWISQSGNYVQTSRTITAGDGLAGGGNLTADRTLTINGSVVRTGGNQTIAGVKTFSDDIVRIGGASNRRVVLGGSSLNLYGSTAGWAMGVSAYNNDGTNIGTIAGALGGNNTFTYYYYGGSYDNPSMVIKDSNLGIGTTSPSQKLHVVGSGLFTEGLGAIRFCDVNMTNCKTITELSTDKYLSGISYNTSTRLLTFTVNGGTPVTWTIPNATTAQTGIVMLSSSTTSTSTTLAATPSAVRTAYNLAASKVGTGAAATANYIPKFSANGGAQITNSNISDNGTKVVITSDLEVQGKVITDTLVNRLVENITVSGSLVGSAPTAYRNLGSSTTGREILYVNNIVGKIGNDTTSLRIVVQDSSSGFKIRTLASDIFNLNLGNYVDKTSPETITGQKTFTSDPIILSTSVNNSVRGGLQLRTTNTTRYASINAYQGASNAYMGLDIQTSNNAAPTSAVRITPNGNVGIGTTSPGAKLHVGGEVIADAYYYKSIIPDDDAYEIKDSQRNDSTSPVGAIYYNTGNVGIGTNSPSQKLHVVGDINTTTAYLINGTNYSQYFISGAGTNGQVWKSDGVGAGYWAADNSAYVHPTQTAIDVNATDNGVNVIDRIQVNTTGHVISVITRNLSQATTTTNGVMSAYDKNKLDGIAAGANNYVHPTTHAPSIIAQDASNRFVTDTEKSTWNRKVGTGAAATANYIPKFTANGGATITNSQIFDNGTNVGIGTTSPGAKLHVLGSAVNNDSTSIRMQNTAGGGEAYQISAGIFNVTEAGFSIRNTTNNTIPFVISNGNVGIGTTSPNASNKLQVAGVIAGDKIVSMGNNIASTTNATAADIVIGLDNFGGTRHDSSIMFFSTASASRILNKADNFYFSVRNQGSTDGGANAKISATNGESSYFMGNLGIGTINPGNKLHVNGNIGANGWIGAGCEGSCEGGGGYALMYANGTIVATSSVTAQAFYYSSDISLKKDLTKITNPLQKIVALNGYNFTWKSDNIKDIGVVAQEVEKVFPDAVKADDKGLKSVKYGNLVAPIIEAIKELYNKYIDQQKKIDELEIRINSLERLLK